MGGGAEKAAGAVGVAIGNTGGAGCPSAAGALVARFPRTRVLAGAAGTTGVGATAGVVAGEAEISGAGELAGGVDVSGVDELAGLAVVSEAAALVEVVEVVADDVADVLTVVLVGGLMTELEIVTGVEAADDEESVDEALVDADEA